MYINNKYNTICRYCSCCTLCSFCSSGSTDY